MQFSVTVAAGGFVPKCQSRRQTTRCPKRAPPTRQSSEHRPLLSRFPLSPPPRVAHKLYFSKLLILTQYLYITAKKVPANKNPIFSFKLLHFLNKTNQISTGTISFILAIKFNSKSGMTRQKQTVMYFSSAHKATIQETQCLDHIFFIL